MKNVLKLDGEHWSYILSKENVLNERCTIFHLQTNLEDDLPKFIKKNPNLHRLYLILPFEVENFNTKFLKEALKEHKKTFDTAGVNGTFKLDGEPDHKELNLNPIFECLEDFKISSFYLRNINFNDSNLKCLEKIQDLNFLQAWGCSINEKINSNCSFQASTLNLRSMKSLDEKKMYKFIGFFQKMKVLNLNDVYLDYLKLKESLKDVKLSTLTFNSIKEHKNEENLKELFESVEKSIHMIYLKGDLLRFPFFSMLKDHKTLKEFENNESVYNFQDLDTFLKNNHSLKKLKLELGYLLNDHDQQVEILCKGISSNHNLKTLLLIRVLLKEKTENFFHILSYNSSISHLQLRNCEIGNQGCTFLANCLSKNTTLTKLDLTSNKFNEKGLKEISQSIMFNKMLKELKLDFNSIEDEGCFHLKDLLSKNQVLTSLSLNECSFETKGFVFLSQGLISNKSLTFLDCQENSLNYSYMDEMDEIRSNLFYNQNLIDFTYNQYYMKDEYIKSIIERNSSLIQCLKISRRFYIDFHFNF